MDLLTKMATDSRIFRSQCEVVDVPVLYHQSIYISVRTLECLNRIS